MKEYNLLNFTLTLLLLFIATVNCQKPCLSNPCQNGGKCKNSVGTYTCKCFKDYTGSNCETYINFCASNPCNNFVNCISGNGKYQCQCKPGFTGKNCDNDINECKLSPCADGAKCVNTDGSFYCKCPKGWTNSSCTQMIDPCTSNPCFNGGKCSSLNGNYVCSCLKGFEGLDCKSDVNECIKSPCLNSGTCFNTYGSYQCICLQRFYGINCESTQKLDAEVSTNLDYCSSNPCKNGGTCITNSDGFSCSCAAQWSGNYCETPFENQACWRGTYSRGVGRPMHTCPNGYEKNGALCYPKCPDGYLGVGPVCWQMCANGFTDDGITCRVPLDIFGKGCCCLPPYTRASCCNNCDRDGYLDDGCTCRRPDQIILKKTTTRGAGIPLICDSNEDYDAGLCYNKCANGYIGIGPICWKSCPAQLPTYCGVMCTQSSDKCKEMVVSQVFGPLTLAGGIGLMFAPGAQEIGAILINEGIGFLLKGYFNFCTI